MIARVVVIPSAPLLLPEYAGRIDAGGELRSRCVEVVGRAAAEAGGPLTVLAATDRAPRSSRPALGARVGAEVLRQAGIEEFGEVLVPWDAPVYECIDLAALLEGTRTLLVVADGSARRSEKAPGHFDERSFAFDEALVDGLRAIDLERLLALDPQRAADLVAQGRAPLQVAAAALRAAVTGGEATAYRPSVLEVSDPFGVLYVVAALEAL